MFPSKPATSRSKQETSRFKQEKPFLSFEPAGRPLLRRLMFGRRSLPTATTQPRRKWF
jgi:hypothetical protein